ncbi:MAG: DoxX family protein [Candidatus Lambdaproteobacteria bacterium]|nr:DoxX family protein [Candidatus Lambdaproteobacteria bacterium]
MWNALVDTDPNYFNLIIRVVLGIVILPHGLQKTLGWFGGRGFKKQMAAFTDNMKIPWIFALLAIIAESFGALGLIVGLLGRVAALGVGCVMVVAIFKVHTKHGFFMNWGGAQKGEGYEFHLLAIAMALVVVLWGSGAWSLDLLLTSSGM